MAALTHWNCCEVFLLGHDRIERCRELTITHFFMPQIWDIKGENYLDPISRNLKDIHTGNELGGLNHLTVKDLRDQCLL